MKSAAIPHSFPVARGTDGILRNLSGVRRRTATACEFLRAFPEMRAQRDLPLCPSRRRPLRKPA